MKNNRKSIKGLEILVVILILIISSSSIYLYFKKPSINKVNCDISNSIYSKVFNNTSDPINGGGWIITILNMDCPKLSIKTMKIDIIDKSGLPIIHITDNETQIKNLSAFSGWFLFEGGYPFLLINGNKTFLTPNNYYLIDSKNIITLKNTSVFILFNHNITKDPYLHIGDTVYVFRDIDNNGINEISSSNTIEFAEKNNLRASCILI